MSKWTQSVERLRIRPAQPWAWVAALSEFGGGLLLALGLLSPLGSLAIVGTMLVAIATVHLSKGFWVTKGGYEFNLAIIGGAVALALTGPGAYSLDNALGLHLPEPAILIIGTIAVIVGVTVTLASRKQAEPASKPQIT
jgi:putative oxidoreductase